MQYKRLQPIVQKKNHYGLKIGIGVAFILLGIGLYLLATHRTSADKVVSSGHSSQLTLQSKTTTPPLPPPDACHGQTGTQTILVSISKQHLWACSSGKTVYNAAVITGMEQYPADLTPVGTYHIYAKAVNQTLAGHDSTGSWSDPVSYWMPFLDNNYGTYGFHDATWRKPSEFGNVNINSPYTANPHASHGCVESNLATAKWLYNWAPIGTTVTVES